MVKTLELQLPDRQMSQKMNVLRLTQLMQIIDNRASQTPEIEV